MVGRDGRWAMGRMCERLWGGCVRDGGEGWEWGYGDV